VFVAIEISEADVNGATLSYTIIVTRVHCSRSSPDRDWSIHLVQ
jgi:hypothetical protein